jgi:hypothetical protein
MTSRPFVAEGSLNHNVVDAQLGPIAQRQHGRHARAAHVRQIVHRRPRRTRSLSADLRLLGHLDVAVLVPNRRQVFCRRPSTVVVPAR